MRAVTVLSIIWSAALPAPMVARASRRPLSRPASRQQGFSAKPLLHLPNCSGRARRCEPVRAIHNMPSSTPQMLIDGLQARPRSDWQEQRHQRLCRVVDQVSGHGWLQVPSLETQRWRYGTHLLSPRPRTMSDISACSGICLSLHVYT
jgi:hypothetical protein